MSTLYVDNLQPNLGSEVEISNLKANPQNVLKTELFVNTNSTEHSSTSYTDVITYTYTPVSATSRIIFQTSTFIRGYNNGTADARFKYRILVNGSEKAVKRYCGIYDYGSHGTWSNGSYSDCIEFDSVSTAALTIKIQTGVIGSGGGVRTSENGDPSTLLVTEIAQ